MSRLVNHLLFTPTRLGAHHLASRLVLPPMASATADEAGLVTSATLAHYDRIVTRAQAVAFVEYTYVDPLGRSEPNQTGLVTEAHAQGLGQLAALMRARSVLPGIQLTHGGGKSDEGLIGRRPLAPSAVAVPSHGKALPVPDEMTEADVARVWQAFVVAALRAERMGFEVIEVHAAHGYFFNQWLSPITNRRQDGHGGSLAARAGLLRSLIVELRRVLRPDTVLSVRFPAQDRLEGGLTLDDTVTLAHWLKADGVDVLNVSSGLGGWRRGREQRGEGYLVDDAAVIKAAADMPVIGVGGITTLDYVADTLGRQRVDFVAVGRAILENPQWPECA